MIFSKIKFEENWVTRSQNYYYYLIEYSVSFDFESVTIAVMRALKIMIANEIPYHNGHS
jgi:hypothetical protein